MSEYYDDRSAVSVKSCICHQSFSDIRDYVNIVCCYSCKVCDYSCTDVADMRSHVVGNHFCGTDGMEFIASDGNAGASDSSTVQVPSSELAPAAATEQAYAVGTVEMVSKEFSTISQSGCDFLSSTAATYSSDSLAPQPLQSTLVRQTLQLFVKNQEVQLNCFSGEGIQDNAVVARNVPADAFANASHENSLVHSVSSVQAVGTLADQPSSGQSAESSKQVTGMYVCDSCFGTVFREVGIVEHMPQVHGIHLDSVNVAGSCDQPITLVCSKSTEITMPPNTISVGTQTQLSKKPGRKRKIITDAASSAAAAEEQANKRRESIAAKDIAAALAMKTLGIERLTASDGQNGLAKRRVQPPRALVEDYHILRLRQSTPRVRSSAVCPTAELVCSFIGCSATFRQQEAVDYHVKCHTVGGPFCCPECRSSFAEWSAMLPHLWTVHGVDLYAYQCRRCDFRADRSSAITEHTVVKHGASKFVQPFLCSICGQTFRKASLRNQHEKSHNSRGLLSRSRAPSDLVAFRRLLCDICKRSFASRKSLNKHIEVKCSVFVKFYMVVIIGVIFHYDN